MNLPTWSDVNEFWFGPRPVDAKRISRPEWFGKAPEFDQTIRSRFVPLIESAATGGCAEWLATATSNLALCLVLDQFPRNAFRNTPRAFGTDPAALAAARHAVASGFDRALDPIERWFIYLPFEHSESLADQDEAVRLFDALPAGPEHDNTRDYARRHREVIAAFGRFPHRNVILGRTSTADELVFLAKPGSSF